MISLDVKRWPDDPRARAALERMAAARRGPDPHARLEGAGLDFRGADLTRAEARRAELRGTRPAGGMLAGASGTLWRPIDVGAAGAPEPLDGEAMFRRPREQGAGEVAQAQALCGPPGEL